MTFRYTLRTLAAVLASAGAATTGAQAPQEQDQTGSHTIEAYVSSDAVQGLYQRDLSFEEIGRTHVYGGVFFNEARDLIAIAGALVRVGLTDPQDRLQVQIGPRMYGAFLNGEDQDIFGIGLGGEARYAFGPDRGSAFVLSAYYAPDILAFGIADEVMDASVRFETRLREGTTIFAGFRMFEFDLPLDREVDDNLHVGFRRDF